MGWKNRYTYGLLEKTIVLKIDMYGVYRSAQVLTTKNRQLVFQDAALKKTEIGYG